MLKSIRRKKKKMKRKNRRRGRLEGFVVLSREVNVLVALDVNFPTMSK